ncbi:MAG: hypothetical protein AAF519_12915 [Bacteroidota bacterium]
MKISNLLTMTALACLLFLMGACSSDDDGTVNPLEGANFMLFVNTSSESFEGLILPFDDFPEGTVNPVDVTGTVQHASMRHPGLSFGNAMYMSPGPNEEAGIQRYVIGENGDIQTDGFLAVPGYFAEFVILSETEGYYYDFQRNNMGLQKFNPTSMARTGEIDLSSDLEPFSPSDTAVVVLESFLIERNGTLVTQMHIESRQFGFDALAGDKTFIVTIDKDAESATVSTYEEEELRIGYFGIMNYFNWNEADDGYLYFASRFKNPIEGEDGKVFRLLPGQNVIDPNWSMDLGSSQYVGGPALILGGPTPFGDKLYMQYYASPFSTYDADDCFAYEIDIATREATRIDGIPAGNNIYLNGPQVVGDKIFFAVSNDTFNGYYSYDPITQETQPELTLEGGSVHGLYILDDQE